MDFNYDSNRIYIEDLSGKVIAKVDFPEVSEGVVNINRTFVDDSLRGQGIAGKLLFEVAAKLRSEGKKLICGCPYAANWFEKHHEFSDLLEM